MASSKNKQVLLDRVHELLEMVRTVPDMHELTKPFRDALLRFHGNIGRGPEIKKPEETRVAWNDLEEVFDYYEPSFIKRDWWKVLKDQFLENKRSAEAWADTMHEIRNPSPASA